MIHGVENTPTIFIVFVGIERCFGITASEVGIRRYLQPFERFKVRVDTNFFDIGFIVRNNTVLIVITQRHQASCFFVTTTYGKTVILLQGRAVNSILPLVGFAVCDRVAFVISLPFLDKSVGIAGSLSSILESIILLLHISDCFHVFRFVGHTLDTPVSIEIYSDLTFFSTFGCYEHNSVGGTRTVDSCRRSVFQDRNTFNIVRVDIGDTLFNTIYQQ
nr:hypothetical protein [Parabacteroides timonensis]